MIKYLIFDTETDGLNIRTSRPFMFQYGLVDENLNLVQVTVCDPRRIAERLEFLKHLRVVTTIVGANIKFDVHMAVNSGIPINEFVTKNFIDVGVLSRLVLPGDIQKHKDFKTALKVLAVRYLDIHAADDEIILKREYNTLRSEHMYRMRDYFVQQGVWMDPPDSKKATEALHEIYDHWFKYFHLYSEVAQARSDFLQMDPPPTYEHCPSIRIYAENDVRLTYGLFKLWYPKAVLLKQTDTLVRTSRATVPLILMERKGMVVDLERVHADRVQLVEAMKRARIIDPRTGQEVSIGQHAVLKAIYEHETGMSLTSSDKDTRELIYDNSPTAQKVDAIAQVSKYLSTYIKGILEKVVFLDGQYRVFTQFKIDGTVTGRLSSNFQQFPKDSVVLDNGYEVNVRSWFKVPKENKYMFYFDYSQMELRLQCEWTNVINGAPDTNLARGFMPYQCQHYRTLETYAGRNGNELRAGAPTDLDLETALKKGWSAWIDPETNAYWQPIDFHTSTATHAFPTISTTDPDWKKYRTLGKRANFAINFGAGAAKLVSSLRVSFTTANSLIAGYKQTFKGVVQFKNWLKKRVYTSDRTPNLLGRYYYTRDTHALSNWTIQGSGADILLEKLHEIYMYIKDKPHWNLMLCVHDEVVLTCDDIDPARLNKEVREIQELMTYKLSAVDIVTDVEYATTRWSEKEDWKGIANATQEH